MPLFGVADMMRSYQRLRVSFKTTPLSGLRLDILQLKSLKYINLYEINRELFYTY